MSETIKIPFGDTEMEMSIETARKIAFEYESYQIASMMERQAKNWYIRNSSNPPNPCLKIKKPPFCPPHKMLTK